MKNIISFDDFINESLLLESFQSLALAEFVKDFPANSYQGRLPKGIRWNEIPTEEVIAGESQDPEFKKQVKNSDYVVFWYSNSKQLVKWKQDTYSRYGSKRENSIYLPKDYLLITKGNEFLTKYSSRDFTQYEVATERYDKPMEGAISVKRLYDELVCNAIAIKWDTLVQYSSSDLRKSRNEQKTGALALMKETDILYQNQKRYEDAIKAAKLDRESKPIASKVETVAAQLKKKIEEAAQIKFSEVVTFSIGKFGKEGEMQTAYLNKIDYTKVEALTKEYNELVYAFNRWYEEFKNYIRNNSDSYKRWADDREEDLNRVLAKY